MKYLFILLLLAGCSKSSVSPNLTGHWVFSQTSFSGDFTIAKSGDNYVVSPGGNFMVNGHTYTTGPDLMFIPNGTNSYLVQLRTIIFQDQASWLQFDMTVNSNFSTVTGGNPISWHEFILSTPGNITDGYFNVKSFPI